MPTNPIPYKHLQKGSFLSIYLEGFTLLYLTPSKFSPSPFMQNGLELFFPLSIALTFILFSYVLTFFTFRLNYSNPYVRLGTLGKIGNRFKRGIADLTFPEQYRTFFLFGHLITFGL